MESVETYTLSPCMPLSPPSTCPDCADSFVFARDGGNSYSFGNTQAFEDHTFLGKFFVHSLKIKYYIFILCL